MSITFAATLNMDGNSIENVEQLDSLNSVATVGMVKDNLSAKANTSHVHDATDIQNIANIFQDITLDGGVI